MIHLKCAKVQISDNNCNNTIAYIASKYPRTKMRSSPRQELLSPSGRAQWIRGRASDSRLRGPGFESCAAVLKPWASCFHSTLFQFTQLYTRVPGYRQWWIYTSRHRALIAACGWMLPREVETVSD